MIFIDRLETNKALIFLKEYLSVIIAIPSIIGGIVQFLCLTDMSMDLLKFFSLSQLLIDGILILTKFSLAYVLVNTLNGVYLKCLFKHNKISNVYFIILVIATLTFGCLFTYLEIVDQNNVLKFTFMYYFMSGVIMLFAGVFHIIENIYIRIVVVAFFATLLNIIPQQKSEIENFSDMTNKIKVKNKNVRLTYFNDQFLFFETNKGKDDNKIIIKKMDEIFEDETSSK